MKFIVVGVQRSGTNYCTEILKSLNNNQRCDIIETGSREYLWKHALPNESGVNYSKNFNSPAEAVLKSNLSVILVHKHPLWWLSSIINRDSADLSRQRSFIYNENNILNIKKALEFYADFYCQWLDALPDEKINHVSYHEILNDHADFVSKINLKYSLNFSGDLEVGSLKVPYSKGGFSARKNMYNSTDYGLDERVLKEFQNAITQELKEQYGKIGYYI